jgi:hypothetical protein
MPTLLVAALLAATSSAAPAHFDVTASFAPGRAPGKGEVSVTFAGRDPDVRINAHPAPKLAVEGGLLIAQPLPAGAEKGKGKADGEAAYLDTALPVVFTVGVPGGTPKGAFTAKASVTYFYCSKRDGWCRKGTTPVEFPVTLK